MTVKQIVEKADVTDKKRWELNYDLDYLDKYNKQIEEIADINMEKNGINFCLQLAEGMIYAAICVLFGANQNTASYNQGFRDYQIQKIADKKAAFAK